MKKIICLGLAVVTLAWLTGCAENKTRIGEGAGIGGLLGAVAGGVIGHQGGNDVAGALIGGAVGAAGGAIVGSQIDKPQAATAAPATTTAAALSIQNVVDLAKQGLSSDDIIAKLKTTKSQFALTAEDLDYLKKQGVSQRVMDVMQGKS
ncbi:MAG: hypothetical protein HQL23_01550 [Candidatus Omnitrophica bacterium]|nr:hypothetical protein [Candidatus Omnitrophota bacterium]